MYKLTIPTSFYTFIILVKYLNAVKLFYYLSSLTSSVIVKEPLGLTTFTGVLLTVLGEHE